MPPLFTLHCLAPRCYDPHTLFDRSRRCVALRPCLLKGETVEELVKGGAGLVDGCRRSGEFDEVGPLRCLHDGGAHPERRFVVAFRRTGVTAYRSGAPRLIVGGRGRNDWAAASAIPTRGSSAMR